MSFYGQWFGSVSGNWYGPAVEGGFPLQFAGLRTYYGDALKELCLVAEADAPGGMGGVVKLYKNGVPYALYLTEIGDPNASSVRVRTTTGTKALRLKT